MFCWHSISNVTKLCPPFARCIGSKRLMWMCQSPLLPYLNIPRLSLSLANISLQYKLLGTRSRPMDTKNAITCFSKKMFAVGTHWKRLFLMWMTALPLAD